MRKPVPDPDPIIRQAVELMSERCGIVVPPYRFPVLRAQLERLGGQDGAAHGLDRLDRGDEEAWSGMITVTAIPETYFFRHPGHFELISRRGFELALAGRVCRVLCAGCSTGEEVWSAAAILAALPAVSAGRHQVTGWDLSEHRLRVAARGRYRPWSCRKGFYRYEHFFERDGDEWRVAPELRPLARFSRVNLIDPKIPVDGFDAILFRNVSIYWDQDTVDDVTTRLTERLVEDGYFLVGPSDPVSLPSAGWQQSFEDGSRVYRRRRPDEPTTHARRRPAALGQKAETRSNREGRIGPSRRAQQRDYARRPMASDETPTAAPPPQVAPADKLLARVRSLADKGAYEQALEVLAQSEALTWPENILWEGVLLLNLGREKEAIDSLRKCVFLEPDEPSYRRWLAVAYEAMGRSAEATRENRNATELEER